jgi:hypothetical protein
MYAHAVNRFANIPAIAVSVKDLSSRIIRECRHDFNGMTLPNQFSRERSEASLRSAGLRRKILRENQKPHRLQLLKRSSLPWKSTPSFYDEPMQTCVGNLRDQATRAGSVKRGRTARKDSGDALSGESESKLTC